MSDRVENYQSMLEEVSCNLCGADDFDVVYSAQYENAQPDEIMETFRSSGDEILVDQLVRCKICDLQYLSPRLKSDVILTGYSEGTDENFISQNPARERTFAKSLELIERLVPDKGCILDIGTAAGAFLGVAKSRGWEVAGSEPNRWMAEWGNEHYGIDIQPGTVFDMNLPDAHYDVVTLWDVLEHTPDPKAVLRECRRVLKPNGLLIVNYPDINSVIARLMGRKWVFLISVHLYFFTIQTIREMLNQTGFKMQRSKMHWQSLELGYIFFRMGPYISWLSKLGTKIATVLRVQHMQIPYWMGQTLVLARRVDNGGS
ncbi:MAG: class I SAM-dependent methyltransferase [Anaerolineales bacterium]|nr:class I SAM-dependent methyltransferase [Chloroflexota bacterium]MBL6979887.1 class I SAM-dependent methyltransferase [Anaerolineales bacterium]